MQEFIYFWEKIDFDLVLQEEQIIQAQRQGQKGFEESADCEDLGWQDPELRIIRKGKKATDDCIGSVSTEPAQSDGHPESGESVFHSLHQEQRQQSAQRIWWGNCAEAVEVI